ncbi:response regulator [Roseomonas sp. KE2513]|uniref:response regulator n=1 Tax=Roseomonas sp. KE2513 TaxID=2479202 RepID=UPI0018DFF34F|nr:response regulator [Roseomonas sp. KE2513]MBI0534890.1 response regulator [Roseomonas sp. KE2513]
MAEPALAPHADRLHGRRLLVVEDEYVIAMDMARALEELGAEVVGPAGSVADALLLVRNEDSHLDAAVLDVNLRNERVFPVAEALAARGVPFVFATGYDTSALPRAYAGAPRCEKPVNKTSLARLLAQHLGK